MQERERIEINNRRGKRSRVVCEKLKISRGGIKKLFKIKRKNYQKLSQNY